MGEPGRNQVSEHQTSHVLQYQHIFNRKLNAWALPGCEGLLKRFFIMFITSLTGKGHAKLSLA